MGEILQRLQKILTLFAIILLIGSSLPFPVSAIEEENSTNDLVLVKLTEDILVNIEQKDKEEQQLEELGSLKEDSLFFAKQIEHTYQIQWNNTYVKVNSDSAQVVNEDKEILAELFTDYSKENAVGLIHPHNDMDIQSEEGEKYFYISLNKDQVYPITEETEEAYSLIIGNRNIQISKSKEFTFTPLSNYEEQQNAEKEEQSEAGDPEGQIPTDTETDNVTDNEVLEQQKPEEQKAEQENSKKEPKNQTIKESTEKVNIQSQGENLKNENYETTNFGKYFEVINDDAIVYDNRSTSGLIKIGTLVKGETYPIVSDYGNWHRIQFGNHYGYVHKKNTIVGNKSSLNNMNRAYKTSNTKVTADQNVTVYDNTSGYLVPFAEIEKGKSYHIATDYGNWYRIIFSDRVGYIHKSDVTRSFTKQTKYFEVTKDKLPVYDNRTGELVKVGTLEKDQIYPRVSDYGNWHRIQFGDHYGYVLKADTVPSNGKGLKNENKNYKKSSEKVRAIKDTIVYDNTGEHLVPFATLEQGKVFPIVSDYGNWYRILVSGRMGYINKNDIKGYFSKNSKYFEVTKDNLEVYDNRQGSSLKKIGVLKAGQVYERVSDYGNWHRVQFGNHYGYVHKSGTIPSFKGQIPNRNSKYKNSKVTFTTEKKAVVYDNSSGKLVPFAEFEKGEEHPVASNYGNWYRILIANKIGYVHKDNVKVNFNKSIKHFRVIQSNLPIYDNRGGSLKKVGTLTKGQTYRRVSDYGNWHRIQFGDYYGYVRKAGTEVGYASAFKNKIVRNYKNGKLTPKKKIIVYDNTGKSLSPFATISKGKQFPVVRDYGNWYEINFSGRSGYVRKNEVTANVMVAKHIVNPRTKYTYEHMRSDINQLERAYPGLISWTTIGKSVDGRNLYAIKLGNGKKEIFLNGAHHAREWLTTNLLMEMIDVYSQSYVRNQKYGGYDVRKILNEVSIWFVPMVNPDGVSLVQKGAFSSKNPAKAIRLNGGSTNFRAWKANVRGVDLNRQYPAGWGSIQNLEPRPGPERYKGRSALSEPESRAVYNFTKAHNFKTAVAYHSSGEVLYWDYKISSSLRPISRRIANKINAKTGYNLMFSGSNPSGGGYTDWFITSIKKPGFTPEISPSVGPRPVPVSYFNSIWRKNNTIGLMLAKEASTR